MSSHDDTPLAGQQTCVNGHLCSGVDNYCSTCGAKLDRGNVHPTEGAE